MTALEQLYYGEGFFFVYDVLFQEKGILTIEFYCAGLPHLLGWLGVVLDKLPLLVEHLDEYAVAPAVGGYKLKQKLSLRVIPLDVFVVLVPLGDTLLKIGILDPDLASPILTLHLRY